MSVTNQLTTGKQLPLTGVRADANPFTPGELWDQVNRILSFTALQHSETHRRLLRYLAEVSIEGRTDLKEYTIGLDALGKSADYNPQSDSTVRVQIGKL